MNLHKIADQDLDALFTQALQPMGNVQPQPQAWSRLRTRLIDAPPNWRLLRNWITSPLHPIRPFSSQPTYIDGRCVRAPYLESFASQMLNLRLAS